ncbi:MAG TPA: S-layer protein, partial [Gemmataceae bacterium]|nr:S-layer protein [Gemmataceae bacterium]
MSRLAITAAVLLALPGLARAADEPSYQRHVSATFSKLGCNGGTCHGAVNGQNGFRLSLFGADPVGDHDRLLREFGGRRVNLTDAPASLLLVKATGSAPHGGGKRLDP